MRASIDRDSRLVSLTSDVFERDRSVLSCLVPVQHVHLTNLHASSRVSDNDRCGIDNRNCLVMIEGEPLDIVCAADGLPRPELDILFESNFTKPTIMALASGIQPPSTINDQFKPSAYEAYRIVGLTPEDNGRNLTCHVDMKQGDKKLIQSITKQLYIECERETYLVVDFNTTVSAVSRLVRPTVMEKSKKIYAGINQTRTINCTVARANPSYLRYTVNGLSSSVIRRTYGDQNGLFHTMDITPTSVDQFRPFNITANNSVGFDTCTYELIHGGKHGEQIGLLICLRERKGK